MKKILNSDWLTAVQFFRNAVPKNVQALKYVFHGRLTKCPMTLSSGRTYV